MVSATTKIEWCDATWNPITGCTPCSPGCDHCYAARMALRFPHLHGTTDHGVDWAEPGCIPFSRVQFHPERRCVPLHWRKPRRVFVCSMGDLFHPDVVMRADCKWIVAVLNVMRICPQHTFMLLTKRAGYMMDVMSHLQPQPLPNVGLGVTVCNQAEANAKILALLRTPAAWRFVSVEPMLGPVDLTRMPHHEFPGCARIDALAGQMIHDDDGSAWTPAPKLDWVICGGETGPGARAMGYSWPRDLRDQCVATGVPFFYKGIGTGSLRKGHARYHLLDGREWHQLPEVRA